MVVTVNTSAGQHVVVHATSNTALRAQIYRTHESFTNPSAETTPFKTFSVLNTTDVDIGDHSGETLAVILTNQQFSEGATANTLTLKLEIISSPPPTSGTWQDVSTGIGQNIIFSFAIDPKQTSTIYAGVQSIGVYKTTDSGKTWTLASNGLPSLATPLATVIDPASTVYVGLLGGGVFKSTDQGQNWQSVSTGLGSTTVSDLAIDPSNSSILFAATSSGVFKTVNGGSAWSSSLSGQNAHTIIIDPKSPSTVFAGTTTAGMFKTTNGGTNWASASNGLASAGAIEKLAIDPQTTATLYAGTQNGVFKTTDGGLNWSAMNTGLQTTFGLDVESLAIDPKNPNVLYLGYKSAQFGLAKTTNGGSNWFELTFPNNAGDVAAVAVDPVNTLTVYAGLIGTVLRSTTGGQ